MASVTRAVKEELVALGYKLRPGRVLSTLGSLCLETPDVPLSQFIPSIEFCFSLTEKGQRAEATFNPNLSLRGQLLKGSLELS